MAMRSGSYEQRAGAVGRVALVLAAVAYSLVAGSLGENNLGATVAVVLSGLAALLHARYRRGRSRPARPGIPRAGALTWALWLAAFLLWEAVAFLSQETPTTDNPLQPTLSVLMEPILEPHPVRSLGYLCWLVGGWRLLRR